MCVAGTQGEATELGDNYMCHKGGPGVSDMGAYFLEEFLFLQKCN